MASSGSGYDLSSSTFSPDGRLFQVEYASKAVDQANTVIGLKASDGVVLGVAKVVQHKMIVSSTASYKRIHSVDRHVGVASTGFVPDARVLVSRAIDEASDWKEQFGVPIPPQVLADRLAAYVHYFTLHGALRPFGACSVLASCTEQNEPTLWMVEPNGVAYAYKGVAAGKGQQAAKTELEKLSSSPLTSQEAVQQIAKILTLLHRENKDSEGKPLELELSWVCEASGWQHVGVPKDVVAAARAWANEQLEEEEDDDDDDEEEMEED